MSGELKTAKGQILQFDGDCVASLEPVASEIDAAYASGFTVIGADSPTGELRNVPRSDTSELPRYLEVLGPVVGG